MGLFDIPPIKPNPNVTGARPSGPGQLDPGVAQLAFVLNSLRGGGDATGGGGGGGGRRGGGRRGGRSSASLLNPTLEKQMLQGQGNALIGSYSDYLKLLADRENNLQTAFMNRLGAEETKYQTNLRNLASRNTARGSVATQGSRQGIQDLSTNLMNSYQSGLDTLQGQLKMIVDQAAARGDADAQRLQQQFYSTLSKGFQTPYAMQQMAYLDALRPGGVSDPLRAGQLGPGTNPINKPHPVSPGGKGYF